MGVVARVVHRTVGEGTVRMRIVDALVAGTLLVACAGDGEGPQSRDGLSEFVTPEIAEMVDQSGKMPVASLVTEREMSAADAEGRAPLWVRNYAEFLTPLWSEALGRKPELSAVRPCKRTLHVRSPFLPIALPVVRATQSPFGPYWLVFVCDRDGLAGVVAVSAIATDVTVEGQDLRFPRARGGEFKAVPLTEDQYRDWYSPEVAVRTAATVSGRRVASVPYLEASRYNIGGALAPVWRMKAESDFPVRAVRSGTEREVSDLFIGRTGDIDEQARGAISARSEFIVPSPQQPSADSAIGYLEADVAAGIIEPVRIYVERAPDGVLVYERGLSVARAGGQ
jgi:hypothetical protein